MLSQTKYLPESLLARALDLGSVCNARHNDTHIWRGLEHSGLLLNALDLDAYTFPTCSFENSNWNTSDLNDEIVFWVMEYAQEVKQHPEAFDTTARRALTDPLDGLEAAFTRPWHGAAGYLASGYGVLGCKWVGATSTAVVEARWDFPTTASHALSSRMKPQQRLIAKSKRMEIERRAYEQRMRPYTQSLRMGAQVPQAQVGQHAHQYKVLAPSPLVALATAPGPLAVQSPRAPSRHPAKRPRDVASDTQFSVPAAKRIRMEDARQSQHGQEGGNTWAFGGISWRGQLASGSSTPDVGPISLPREQGAGNFLVFNRSSSSSSSTANAGTRQQSRDDNHTSSFGTSGSSTPSSSAPPAKRRKPPMKGTAAERAGLQPSKRAYLTNFAPEGRETYCDACWQDFRPRATWQTEASLKVHRRKCKAPPVA